MSTLKEVFIQFYPKLVAVLPMSDALFMAKLYSQDLLPGDSKAQIEAKPTTAERASCFLDTVIERGFVDDNTNPTFYSLLSIMQENDDPLLRSLAETIKKSNYTMCV